MNQRARLRHTLVRTALGFTLAASPAMAQWRGQTVPSRLGARSAFDTARGVTVLFGGHGYNTVFGDTWEWDGSRWANRALGGPSPRSGAAMAFDTTRAQTLVFGGVYIEFPPATYFGDTWGWDGRAWAQVAAAGPTPRTLAAMAYDSARAVSVLFGGSNNAAYSSETWEWDGVAWSLRSAIGPAGRASHAMAYDSARRVTVLFGGVASGSLGDTWEWDGRSWQPRTVPGPIPRYGHGMAYDQARGVTVMVAGIGNSTSLSDTWEWDGVAWTLRSTSTPLTQDAAAFSFDRARGVSVLFGGASGADTWEWNGTSWSLRASPGPTSREAVGLAADTARNTVVLFGGSGNGHDPSGETWEWNGQEWSLRATDGPSPRDELAMAYDSDRAVTVLFGGSTGIPNFTPLGDTWEWNGTVWSQRAAQGPAPRFSHTLVYDAARHSTVLFGGALNGLVYSNETWTWDGATWSQVPATGPSYRRGHGMAYDSARRRSVLFGGAQPSFSNVADTWEWDGVAWTQRFVTGPSPRAFHAMAFDPQSARILLFGGMGGSPVGNPLAETFAWDGASWTQLPAPEPGPRELPAAAYDPVLGGILMYGGYPAWGDTWNLNSPCAPSISTPPAPASVPDGEAAEFSIAAMPVALTYQWRRNGVPLTDGPRISGAATPTLRIDPAVLADAGWYSCRLSSPCGVLVSPAAPLSILCYPNCDQSATSPVLNINDFVCFLNRFASADPYANCDHSTTPPVLNIADFVCFMDAFASGCP